MKRSCERARNVLGELGQTPVLGAFVSLKRQGELRSCMGCLADSMSLAEAVETSATRAAADDPRFPPVSPTELEHLDMEVWVLWGMKNVTLEGKERINVVEIGKHGLQIQLGASRGLLLPGVATEHKMDAQQFLEAVCRKAGLPMSAWYDPRAKLSIFEGRAISGPFSMILEDEPIPGPFMSRKPGPTTKDVFALCEAARNNFFRYLDGLTPHYYQTDLFDGNVNGLALAISLPDAAPMVCAQHKLKHGIPLQSSLVKFAHALGEQIRRIGTSPEDLLASQFTLTIQWDVAIHGQNDNYDLDSLETSHRSLMLGTKDGWAILFDPSADPEDLLDEARELLGVDSSVEGMIHSFETVSTMSRFELTSFPQDPIYPSLRPATLAGSFYPAQAKDIEAELQRMFRGTEKEVPEEYAAVMVPHAGWIYSGRLAAQTLAKVKIPESVMIFAPKHRPGGVSWAVAPFQTWGVPFGSIMGNTALAEDFVHHVPGFRFDPIPHKQEHAIEVQLPLLARRKPEVKIVGVTMGGTEWEEINESATQFAAFLEQLPDFPLLMISSDLNHYASNELTCRLDRMVLDAMKSLEPERLYEVVTVNRISMCGVCAAVFVLQTLKLLGRLHVAIEVGHTTSGEVSGDNDRVVGYGGMLFR